MATAYTPGLKVSDYEKLAKHRILPLKGEVLVSVGDRVKPETVVARSFLPGVVGMCNVANKLGIDGNEVPGKMLKKEGDEVKEGDVIAFPTAFEAPKQPSRSLDRRPSTKNRNESSYSSSSSTPPIPSTPIASMRRSNCDPTSMVSGATGLN